MLLAAPVKAAVINHGDPGEKMVTLTFDDGPGCHTLEIIELLDRFHARATFFIIGCHAAQHPELVKAIVEKGNEIANHSYSHNTRRWKDEQFVCYDFEKNADYLYGLTGERPSFYRPPGGEISPEVLNYIEKRGCRVVKWSVDPRDWQSSATAERIAKTVVTRTTNGSIIVLHDRPGSGDATVKALPEILMHLSEQGYRFVTLSEMLGEAEQSTGSKDANQVNTGPVLPRMFIKPALVHSTDDPAHNMTPSLAAVTPEKHGVRWLTGAVSSRISGIIGWMHRFFKGIMLALA